jgi:hypothetical protein
MPLRRKVTVLILVVAGLLGGFLASVATDTIRLGPSSYVLPADALGVSVTVTRLADGDPEADYYSVLVLIENRVTDPAIQPYSADLVVRVAPGEIFGGWWPPASDYERTWTLTLPPPDARTLSFPAGAIGTQRTSAFDLIDWTVSGERGLRSQQIFGSSTNFYIETVRVPEGNSLVPIVTVSLVWYFHNALQAYPVASSTITGSP